MILKQLRDAWRKGSTMHDVLQILTRMIGDAEFVVAQAWETCAGNTVAEKVGPLIRQRDKEVNRAEREIRRRVVEHLNLNPGKDVSGCLAILLVAKDVERIGDHGRNIFLVADRLSGRVSGMRFFPELAGFYRDVSVLLPLLQRAVAESNPETARKILEEYLVLKRRIKAFILDLYDAGLSGDEAIATALLARYMRRIIAHIGNAASGIVFPVEAIDYISHGLEGEAKDR